MDRYHKYEPPKPEDIIIEIANSGDTMSWIVTDPYSILPYSPEDWGPDGEYVPYEGPFDKEIISEIKQIVEGDNFKFREFGDYNQSSNIEESETSIILIIRFGEEYNPQNKENFLIKLENGLLNIDIVSCGEVFECIPRGDVLVHEETIHHWEYYAGEHVSSEEIKAEYKKIDDTTTSLQITIPKRIKEVKTGTIPVISF